MYIITANIENIEFVCLKAFIIKELYWVFINKYMCLHMYFPSSPRVMTSAVFEWWTNSAMKYNYDIVFLQLTPVGRQMAAFPLEPRLGKTLLIAKEQDCL